MNDDGLPCGPNVHLLGGCDVKVPQVSLQLAVCGFKVEDRLQQASSHPSEPRELQDQYCLAYCPSLTLSTLAIFFRAENMRADLSS